MRLLLNMAIKSIPEERIEKTVVMTKVIKPEEFITSDGSIFASYSQAADYEQRQDAEKQHNLVKVNLENIGAGNLASILGLDGHIIDYSWIVKTDNPDGIKNMFPLNFGSYYKWSGSKADWQVGTIKSYFLIAITSPGGDNSSDTYYYNIVSVDVVLSMLDDMKNAILAL